MSNFLANGGLTLRELNKHITHFHPRNMTKIIALFMGAKNCLQPFTKTDCVGQRLGYTFVQPDLNLSWPVRQTIVTSHEWPLNGKYIYMTHYANHYVTQL